MFRAQRVSSSFSRDKTQKGPGHMPHMDSKGFSSKALNNAQRLNGDEKSKERSYCIRHELGQHPTRDYVHGHLLRPWASTTSTGIYYVHGHLLRPSTGNTHAVRDELSIHLTPYSFPCLVLVLRGRREERVRCRAEERVGVDLMLPGVHGHPPVQHLRTALATHSCGAKRCEVEAAGLWGQAAS